jgi:KaiC/GvpD/RAD55 family RecA-like ATPase
LSDILLSHDLETVIQLINSISINAWKYEGLHFALLTKGMHDPRVEIAIQHFADGVIDFVIAEGAYSSARNINIKKMQGTLISTRSLAFSIEERGLVVETAMRIT